MSRPLRIGNAQGFWGDRPDAAAEMLALEPDLDFLTLDYLAEVSMSVLALQRSRSPEAGWPRDFLEVVRSLAPYWREGGRCRVITNAGGLNPMACAQACREVLEEAGCGDRTIGVVLGDDVLSMVRAERADAALGRNLDTGESIDIVRERLVTANAYLGAEPLVQALARGADLVIAGRVADPSLTVAPCVHRFGWKWGDWDRLAGATVAGHLIECGTQVTGGISTGWLEVPGAAQIGFPIVEVAPDGSCVVTKPRASGGCVSAETVKEQLVYEIGDPGRYLSPDVTVSFLGLQVEDEGNNRVRVRGASGRAASRTYKVSATYQDGFWAQALLTVYGERAVAKARLAARAVFDRLASNGAKPRQCLSECLGAGACRPQGSDPALAEQLTETVLRMAVSDASREVVERFAREVMPLVTGGPPGTTGYADGRPRVHSLFRFWPCMIEREAVQTEIAVLRTSAEGRPAADVGRRVQRREQTEERGAPHGEAVALASRPVEARMGAAGKLRDIAYARSGDKGIHANVGVIARRAEDFPRLCRAVTSERVASYLGMSDVADVRCYELTNLAALNLVFRGVLANPLRVDAQGKALAQVLLEMPLETQAEGATRSKMP